MDGNLLILCALTAIINLIGALAYAASRQLGWGEGEWAQADAQFLPCGIPPHPPNPNCVSDGDTIRFNGEAVRMMGYDAPEIAGECDAERQLARVARRELTEWLNRGPFEMTADADMVYDQYGRELRAFRRDGEALADYMVDRGLARRSTSGPDWCS